MANTYKVLSQTNPSATTLTDSYTVPAATQAIVSSISVANRSAISTSFRISVAIAGAADDAKLDGLNYSKWAREKHEREYPDSRVFFSCFSCLSWTRCFNSIPHHQYDLADHAACFDKAMRLGYTFEWKAV